MSALSRTRVLFLALTPHGFGETLIGLALADQIASDDLTCRFIVEPAARTLLQDSRHEFDVIEPDMGVLCWLVIDDVVRSFRPDIIVLSDYFTYTAVLRWRYRTDPWRIENYGVPIVPIDIWEWGNTDFVVDIAGDHVYPASDRFLSLPAALRPVPLAHLEPDAAGHALPFRVWEGERPLAAATRDRLRASLGLGTGDRLLLLATARWQVTGDAAYSEAASAVSAGIPALVTRYLGQLPQRAHFLLIGEVPPAWSGLAPTRTHAVPSCPPAEFGAVLQAADAVLSLNVAGTTVWRAALSGVPAMVLGNDFRIRGPGDAAAIAAADAAVGGLSPFVRGALPGCLPLHPFRMWPLAFHSFLAPLLRDNPYTDAFAHAQVLDEASVTQGMESLLFDKECRAARLAAQDRYAEQVRALPPTREVFAAAAARAAGGHGPAAVARSGITEGALWRCGPRRRQPGRPDRASRCGAAQASAMSATSCCST